MKIVKLGGRAFAVGQGSMNQWLRSCLWSVLFFLLFGALSVSAADQPEAGPGSATATRPEPQQIALSSFQAFDAGGQVLVRWETGFEVGTLGFDLYRQANGGWVKVNRGLIPAQDSMLGGKYHQLDQTAKAPGPHRYRLAVALTSGQAMELKAADLQASGKVDVQDLRPQGSQSRMQRQAVAPTEVPATRRVSLASGTASIDLPNGPEKVKILTTAQGMHFLSTAGLANLLGQLPGTVQGWIINGDIAMQNQGLPVNFVPGQGLNLVNNTLEDGLYFYAEGFKNNYTATNVYWILKGHNTSVPLDGLNPDPVLPGPFTAVLDAELEQRAGLSVVQNPEDDYFFWEVLTADSVADTLVTPFTLERLVRTAGTTANLAVRLYGGSETSHRVRVGLNLWSNLGSGASGGSVNALAIRGTTLFAGGAFTSPGGTQGHIAKWTGSQWSALRRGVDNTVNALAVSASGTEIYAGGAFTKVYNTATPTSANRVAKWNDTTSSWSALGSTPTGGGVGGTVNALAVIGSQLYAGGAFTTAGGISANRVAGWSGTAWSALGAGVNGDVNAMAVLGTDLYVGGAFTVAGGSPANYIAKWNGSTWSALGAGLNGTVNALAVIGSDLYVGGAFTQAGGGPAKYIARWNGTVWSALGTEVDAAVRALSSSGSDLYAGGDFLTAGGVTVNRAGKWNGTAWTALDSGADNSVRALAAVGNDLYAGGDFSMAGGLLASSVAKWGNGIWLGTKDWSGLSSATAEFTIDATTALNLRDSAAVPSQGANTLTVRALKPSTLDTRVWLDGYSLSYKRTYFAAGGAQEAEADGNATVTVPNLAPSSVLTEPVILGFDVTDVRQIKPITNLRIDKAGEGTTWEASFTRASADMRFSLIQPLLSTAAQVITVPSDRVSLVSPVNLADPTIRGSYVLIAPSSLLLNAQELANYRKGEFRTKVVLLDDIYNEFSYGLVTPYAISSFIGTAYDNWAIRPRYVVLVGEGTWDYRDLTDSHDSLVPPRMTHHKYGLVASDSLFSNVKNDGSLRVIVGRLPVKTPAEFETIFTKIKNYEAEPAHSSLKALAIADQPDGAGDFITGSKRVQEYLSPTYTTQLVHPDYAPAAIDISVLRGQIQTAFNAGVNGADGVDVVNYLGHGAIDHLGSNGNYYMEVQSPDTRDSASIVPSLANSARLPIFVAMTCVAGDFAQPGWTSFAEMLVRQPGAGSVAAIAPTGLSLDDEAAWINRRIMELLACNLSSRLGDAFVQSATLYNADNTRVTPVWIYGLLGDPALKIKD